MDDLRNLADLLHAPGDTEAACSCKAASDAAPDAPALQHSPANDPHRCSTLPDRTVARLLAEAASTPRSRVLATARAAIDALAPPG